MTPDRERYFEMLKEYSNLAKGFAEFHALAQASDSPERDVYIDGEVNIQQKITKLSNDLTYIILASARGEGHLTPEDIEEGKRIMAETLNL